MYEKNVHVIVVKKDGEIVRVITSMVFENADKKYRKFLWKKSLTESEFSLEPTNSIPYMAVYVAEVA